jgi:hypothetical protein
VVFRASPSRSINCFIDSPARACQPNLRGRRRGSVQAWLDHTPGRSDSSAAVCHTDLGSDPRGRRYAPQSSGTVPVSVSSPLGKLQGRGARGARVILSRTVRKVVLTKSPTAQRDQPSAGRAIERRRMPSKRCM